MIVFAMPDKKISTDVRNLTGREGEIVFLSVDRKSRDLRAIARRFDLVEPGAVMTDEFGNLLASGLESADDIVDAFYDYDDYLAEQSDSWGAAMEKGRLLLEKGELSEATRVLRIFAFARGTKDAEKGRKLFMKASEPASKEFGEIVVATKAKKAADLDAKVRKALIDRLSRFIARWPKTASAFAAEDRIGELRRAEKPV